MPVDLWQFRDRVGFPAEGVDIGGFEVVGRNGSIGTVDKVNNDVSVVYLVVDTGDWMPGRTVALPAGTVERVDFAARRVKVDRTRDDVREAPDFDVKHHGSDRFRDLMEGYYHGLYETGL